MPGTKELNKKSLPSSEKLIKVLKTLSTKKNCDFINGTLSIIIPKKACSPSPQNIVSNLIAFRLLESA